jgi:glyoxylase-like metal-dependent hydrolase (beta-lactamase superfamily II)
MDFDVHLIDRGRIEADANFVLDGSVVATASEPNPDLDYAEFLVWTLVIDHPEATILWDTGSHPEAGDGYWPAPLYEAFAHVDAADHDLADDLADAGFALADIDAVVQSHLHLDHAGGLYNFAGTDTPVFVHEQELKRAYFAAALGREGAYVRGDFDHDLAWEPLYGDGGLLVAGVEWLHLPGHTPGMVGLLVEDGAADDRDLLVVGDLAYSAKNYEDGHPMGRDLLDSRPDWRASLRRAREIERRRDALVVYGHDPEQVAELPGLL